MESENIEILLHTAVKTEVEAINQQQHTNSMLIGLQTETPQEDQKGFVMKQELYNGAGTQLMDIRHGIRPEEGSDNVPSSETREQPKAEGTKGNLQIHGMHVGNYLTQDTPYDQLNPDVRDVLSIQDSKCDIQTNKCMDEHQIQNYNESSNSNDIWEFVSIQDPRSKNQTQDAINFHPSQDIKHWTVTSTSLLPCVKLEGDGMTRNKYPGDTKGMLIKSENCSLDTVPSTDLTEEYRADVTVTYQMPDPDLRAMFPPPIVIQPAKTSYKCTLCDEAFDCKGSLLNHQWTHSWAKPYKCNFCGSGFSKNGDLTTHERTHTGEKPIKCGLCEKRFVGKDGMKKHQKTHTREKPHKCTVCGKAFTYNSRLLSHQSTHSQAKPYKCTFCGSVFSKHYNLTIHELIHTGETHYKCDVCDKQFHCKGNLKNHQLRHTACTVYHKQFAQSCVLARHRQTHTGKNPVQ